MSLFPWKCQPYGTARCHNFLFALFLVQYCAMLQVKAEEARVYIITLNYPPPITSFDDSTDIPDPTDDTSSVTLLEYESYLLVGQRSLLKKYKVSSSSVVYSLKYGVNGFCAKLTDNQAVKLGTDPQVASVVESDRVPLATVITPSFLNLSQTLWQENPLHGVQGAGEDIVVGVIDSGIWPEHASFSDNVSPPYGPAPAKWRGSCNFVNFSCNNKVLGGGIFYDAFQEVDWSNEYKSPRDNYAHGTHTASIVAGNNNVPVIVNGQNFGTMSGIAPRARLAIYKVFWRSNNSSMDGMAMVADIVAAIDKAIKDGVDVISFSANGLGDFFSPLDMMFLAATKAGIFVSTSAGNGGPLDVSVGNVAPWTATVAACYHDQSFFVDLTFGTTTVTAQSYSGDPSSNQHPLITGTSAALSAAVTAKATACAAKSLDATKVAGKIVVCVRDSETLLTKTTRLSAAGAAGLVFVNAASGARNIQSALEYPIPAVHLTYSDGQKVFSYISSSTGNAVAQFSPAYPKSVYDAPIVALFSARGPSKDPSPKALGTPFGNRNSVLKPDICAPGVNIWAAYPSVGPSVKLPTKWSQSNFNFLSGTSMAAPHIAGIAALIKQKHPEWSPMAIKSAMMTTASTVTMKGSPILVQGLSDVGSTLTPATPFDMGAGHVTTTQILDPGLVYDESYDNIMSFLAGGSFQKAEEYLKMNMSTIANKIASVNLNVPYISVTLQKVRKITARRVVTNVGPVKAKYRVQVNPPANVAISVKPTTLSLGVNKSASFFVTFTRVRANPNNGFSFGSLTWFDGTHSVQSLLVSQTIALK